MDHKQVSQVEIKNADKGEVSIVFATLNVKDKDGDVTVDGAFSEGEDVVISAYQHTSWKGALPVGEGRIRTRNGEAVFDGKFYMETTAGRDTFAVVKARGAKQQWSYGFDTLLADRGTFKGEDVQFLRKLKVHEVSPVMVGAGVNTRTLAVKAAEDTEKEAVVTAYHAAIRPHETAVTSKRWDGTKTYADIPDDSTVDDLRAVHAYVDPSKDPTLKASYGFLHHDSVDGEANLRACLVGIADLNGLKGADLTDPERRAVYSHLAQHLQDGDRDVPDLRSPGETGPLKFHEEAATVLAGLDNLITRTSEVMALRRSKGKAISATTVDVLEWVYDGTKRLRSLLDTPQEDAEREYARYIRQQLLTGDHS